MQEHSKILKFPKDFLWGTSTSAYQVEGGIKNDWSEWEKSEERLEDLKKKGVNVDDYISGQACDSYNRYEEDFDLCLSLNNNAHRLGIEWARIEPEEGKFNMEEVEHYRKVLTALKKRKLKTVVTLWHWTTPLWMAEKGGWTNKHIIDYFTRYVELITKELGKDIDYWVVMNEPLVPLAHGYITGVFAPGKKYSLLKAYKYYKNLLRAYKKSYEIIHQYYPDAKVSVTGLTAAIEAANSWNPLEKIIVKVANYLRNDKFFYDIKGKFDYLGIDYYHHDRIVWYPPFKVNLNEKVNDFGWEIYPQGIYQVLKHYAKFKKPIYILENGTADLNDNHRAQFIVNHLKYVHQAISEGIDVRGYFYWSLLDNFEWAEGFTQHFGLYKVDRMTFKRTAQPSAKVYAEICKENRIRVE